MDPLDTLIDFVVLHPAVLFYIILGIAMILYSCFAKRFSFQGDFPLMPDEGQTYEATPRMRLYGIALDALPLLYGLYTLVHAMTGK